MTLSKRDDCWLGVIAPAMLSIVLLGCASVRTTHTEGASVRELLRVELLRRYSLGQVDTSAIEISRARSRVVPELSYAIGEYSPPGYSWARRSAVLARYGTGMHWRVDEDAGWSALARKWSPSSIDEFRSVCFEVAEFSSPAWYPRSSPVVVSDSAALLSPVVVGRGTSGFARVVLPRYAPDPAEGNGRGTWHFWLLEPGLAVSIACRWQSQGPSLMRADSVAGVGLLKIQH